MAVMISKDKKDLVVTCKCGCGDGVHLQVHNDGEDYAYQCFTNGNFYKEQDGMFKTLKNKLTKIWAIIRNKDYYYSDIMMSREDFKQLKEYINQIN